MDPLERSMYIERLRASRDAFLAAVAGISEEQAAFKPAPERWSIREIAEHIAVTEHGMYRLITKYFEPLAAPSAGKEREILETYGDNRNTRLTAPEPARPKGRYASLADGVRQFALNRDRSIQFVETCEDDLRARSINHPLGRITGQDCLALMVSHPVRHSSQIEDIRNSPAFPVSESA